MKNLHVKFCVPLLFMLWAAGCGPDSPELYRQFQDEDPAVRIKAIVKAGETKDQKSIPYLVDRLTDSESDVRFFAIIALQKITGEDKGYKPWEPEARRKEAVDRWRQYLEERSLTKLPDTVKTDAHKTEQPDKD